MFILSSQPSLVTLIYYRVFWEEKLNKGIIALPNVSTKYCQQIEWENGFWQLINPNFSQFFSHAHYPFIRS